jgi:hypothetical protein
VPAANQIMLTVNSATKPEHCNPTLKALTARQTTTGLIINGSAPFKCGCRMGGVWAFLGEGYLGRNYSYSTGCVQHDLDGLHTFLT